MDVLESLCREKNSDLEENCFQRHTENKTYGKRLTEGLALIYFRLNGDFDDHWGPLPEPDRTAIITRLCEEIKQCTPGVYNRVNYILCSFQIPHHLSQLLYQVREDFIKNIATTLTDDVHSWN